MKKVLYKYFFMYYILYNVKLLHNYLIIVRAFKNNLILQLRNRDFNPARFITSFSHDNKLHAIRLTVSASLQAIRLLCKGNGGDAGHNANILNKREDLYENIVF
jgi:hypothetical protein